ncbi:hypothetical protein U1Q18_050511, partial [Sarracenia purpurea var. burkii]
VIDTIQLVQSLRSFLPPPHIAVSSWKNEDKHSRIDRKSISSAGANAMVNAAAAAAAVNANVMVNSNMSNVDDDSMIRNNKTSSRD